MTRRSGQRHPCHVTLAAMTVAILCVRPGDPAMAATAEQQQVAEGSLGKGRRVETPNVTHCGYVDIDEDQGSAMFYAYYEAQQPGGEVEEGSGVPVILWLQGGPGCSSMLGNMYELGPQSVTRDLGLCPNTEGAWNRLYGLLFVDQPIGTGYSITGNEPIPTTQDKVASDLYIGLQRIFKKHASVLRGRPLVVAGESYAGKYVPSLVHYILQLQEALGPALGGRAPLTKSRPVPPRMLAAGAPLFNLSGAIIGNGLTDPAAQVMTHADVAHALGLIDQRQQVDALKLQLEVMQAIAGGRWEEAHRFRGELLDKLAKDAGLATLLDLRRQVDYDHLHLVDDYLNQAEVKKALGVPAHVVFESCSDRVGEALGPDVMQSVAYLMPDILAALPVLLYQGQMDLQDGPAGTEEWVSQLDWPSKQAFQNAKRRLWRVPDGPSAAADAILVSSGARATGGGSSSSSVGQSQQWVAGGGQANHASSGASGGVVAGYWKSAGRLTQVVLRNAGHLVPHDQPVAARLMVEQWVAMELQAQPSGRPASAAA